MNRPKILPSSMREKKRYIAFEVISADNIEFPDIVNEFWNSLLVFLGELGTSKTNVWFVKDSWDQERQTGLIRCDHQHTEHVRASISMIKDFSGKKAIVHTLGISGTMSAARAKFFGDGEKNTKDL